MTDLISAAFVIGLFVFWGFYLLVVPCWMFLAFRPRTAKEKRSDEKMDMLIKRWGNDPDFDEFSRDRWFGWIADCERMGWFKS